LRLWLIRHGETEWNREGRCQGKSDLDLNETGLAQAKAIGLRFEKVPLVAVHSSPLKRAYKTAQFLAKIAAVEIKLEPGLMELDQGDFEGCVMEEVSRTHSEIIKEWIKNPADMVLPGGESMRQLEQRALASVLKISSFYPKDAQVAAVSHNLALCTILCNVLGIGLDHFRRIRLSPAGVSAVDFTPLGPVLVSMNSTYHLE
jgi:broad specificity phosphatase PhoE